MNRKNILILLALFSVFASASLMAREKLNYYYESEMLLDIKDPIGDDKGSGFYRYPLDTRIKRGAFDLKRFCVYEEGDVIVFEIQMRNYIMRHWPNLMQSTEQGFVANTWDIYIDVDGRPSSGHSKALPGRDLCFANSMGWEKVIMVTPLSEAVLTDILRNKTDEISFQSMLGDIIYPDYIKVQSDRVIIKITKLKLSGVSERSGFQCFCMGYSDVVSPGRLLNRDVKAFSTNEDFGGGSNDAGEPCVIDLIMPNNQSQYKCLRNCKPAMFAGNIRYASVPFVYKGGSDAPPKPVKQAVNKQLPQAPVIVPQNPQYQKPTSPYLRIERQTNTQNASTPEPARVIAPTQAEIPLPEFNTLDNGFKPMPRPKSPKAAGKPAANVDSGDSNGLNALLSEPPQVNNPTQTNNPPQINKQNSGFVPLNKTGAQTGKTTQTGAQTGKTEQFKAPESFIPVSKKK